MEQAVAIKKFIRVPPRKARLAADLVRGRFVEDALAQLSFCNMKGGYYLKKTIQSAVANAEMKFDVKRDLLRVVEVRVDEGPRLKRIRPAPMGRAYRYQRRTAHITIELGEKQ